jgi:hypothetical protein
MLDFETKSPDHRIGSYKFKFIKNKNKSSALQSSTYHPPTPVSRFASAYAPIAYVAAPVAQQFVSECSVTAKVLDRLSNRVDQSFDLMRKNNTMKI